MTAPSDRDTSPISLAVDVSTLPARGRTETIEADETQRRALAAAHGLLAVNAFRADIEIRRWRRDGVRLTGRIDADVTQQCVVSLEPLPATVEAAIDAIFVPEDSALARRLAPGEDAELVIDAEGPDAPEPFVPPMLDIGAAAEEFFELALDPYPRADGAEPPVDAGPDDDEAPDSPFAALAALKPARRK